MVQLFRSLKLDPVLLSNRKVFLCGRARPAVLSRPALTGRPHVQMSSDDNL